jgi:hypothetical protein
LVLPAPEARLVYLDLNHWIGLAKANTGHPDGARHRDALAALRQAKTSGASFHTPTVRDQQPSQADRVGCADTRVEGRHGHAVCDLH